MADTDYDELVDGTVDEVKEAVEEQDLDPEKVLDAEKENKNRVTLVEWLEGRIADQTADEFEETVAGDEDDEEEAPAPAEPAEDAAEDASEGSGGSGGLMGLIASVKGKFFVFGLVVGLLAAAAVFGTGAAPGGGMSADAAGEKVQTYLADNSQDLPISDVQVTNVERMEGSGLYRASLVLTATVQNRSVSQNQTAIVTSDGRYIFFTSPVDTTRPLAQQSQ